jgi:hypothetical protein
MKELDAADLVRELNDQADFPTKPFPKRAEPGGSASVGPNDTIANLGACWCGQENGHDWPGKDDGAPHPRYPR